MAPLEGLKALLPKTFEDGSAEAYFTCEQHGHLSSVDLFLTEHTGQYQSTRPSMVDLGATVTVVVAGVA